LKQRVIILILFLFAFLLLQISTVCAGDKIFNAIASPFPPFTGPNLKDKGVAWEICKAALETQGYTVNLEFAPWARAMEDSKKGKYDGLLPAYKTDERMRFFLYPMPLLTIHTGFIKHKLKKEISYNGDLKTLIGYNIGVGKGYSTADEFDKADYLNKIFVSTTPQILKMLWLGRLDLAVGGLEYSLYYIDEINKDPKFEGIKNDLVIMHPPLKERPVYMIIPKQTRSHINKLNDFNLGMEKIIDNGMYSNIMKQYDLSKYQNKL